MKNRLKLLLPFIFLLIQSCNMYTPENYFGRTVLNTNRYHNLGARDIAQMNASKKANMLYGDIANGEFKIANTYEEHVKGMKMTYVNGDIEKVKELKVTKETEDLIKTSLAVFNKVKSIYENDYITIAKLMDRQAPENEINEAMKNLENSVSQFHLKRKELLKIAVPYAKENGIDFKY